MYCPKCGAEIDNGVTFCPLCGATVSNKKEELSNSVNMNQNSALMSATATSVVAYMTWIGFLVAVCAGDKEDAKFFLNQALVFHIFRIGCFIPFIGWLWLIYMIVCFILGVIWAAEQERRELPLIGVIRILN